MKVRAISVTQNIYPIVPGTVGDEDPEDLMVYCARVSSPQNQNNTETGAKLLKYCFDNGHWSVFEMADMTVEIETSVAVGRQILRHRSFCFQEFSQRYADASELGFEDVKLRHQDFKNRQNSIDDMTLLEQRYLNGSVEKIQAYATEEYAKLIRWGVAKECARMILPMCTTTRMYMKGSVRSFFTYLMVRLDKSTQLEHREVAQAIFEVFKQQFPVCGQLLEERLGSTNNT